VERKCESRGRRSKEARGKGNEEEELAERELPAERLQQNEVYLPDLWLHAVQQLFYKHYLVVAKARNTIPNYPTSADSFGQNESVFFCVTPQIPSQQCLCSNIPH